jgi:uncharacterized protein
MSQMDAKQLMQRIAKETNVRPAQAQQVIDLLEEGNTVPFIARYRKEATGSLDEVQIKAVEDRYRYIQQIEQRKEEVIRLIDEQGKLTDELSTAIQAATVLQRLEDLYRPYKLKRRTKATIAKEKGLEPLANVLFSYTNTQPEELAQDFINEETEVANVEEALQGARDILAEQFADDAKIREKIRNFTRAEGSILSAVKKQSNDEKSVFEMYYDYTEPVKKIVPHRVLALNRGEKEDILKVSLHAPVDRILSIMRDEWIPTHSSSPSISQVTEAIEDSYKRLIAPSVEREIRTELTEKGETQAIHIFSENLRNLLLQQPLKGKVVLGLDPAFRTGCKLAVVDDTGKLQEVSVIYPHPPKADVQGSKKMILDILKRYPISIIAIGNGTASRESEQFVAECLKEADREVAYVIVNEAGASVYSASDTARAEFPHLQVEQRSAVSIARRLQDPLSELVKIEPKAVGVGQYQHDVSQKSRSGAAGLRSGGPSG